MSDILIRRLEREALCGNPMVRERLIRSRIKANLISTDDVDLAAWCMDHTAWKVQDYWLHSDHIEGICPCPACTISTTGKGIQEWSKRLSGWGDEVLIRAAMAAAHLALEKWEAPGSSTLPRAVIETADRWLITGAEEDKKRCGDLVIEMGAEPKFACEAGLLVYWPPTRIFDKDPMHKWARAHLIIKDAIKITDEDTVIDAIAREIVPRALGDIR